MKASTKDQVEGAIRELKGRVKEIAGELTDNPALAAEGSDEKIAGKVQEKIGQIKKVFEEYRERREFRKAWILENGSSMNN